MRYTQIYLDSRLTSGDRQKLRVSAAGLGLILRNDIETIEITCEDIAFVAWGVYNNALFFRQRFGIDVRYRDDFNGGGDQSVEIGKGEHVGFDNYIIRVIYSSSKEGSCIYEADLMMDGRKDYHPTRNLGQTQFFGTLVFVDMAGPEAVLTWVNEGYLKWKHELTRLRRPHSTLGEWAESSLDMAVRCRNFACGSEARIISNSDLRAYHSSGTTLEILRSRLVCKSCKQRNPRVTPF